VRKNLVSVALATVALVIGVGVVPATAASPVSFTILHTNDFHGNLLASGSNPGIARVAQVVDDVRSSVGAGNALLVDAGDEMQGSLLSNLQKGEPTIAAFNAMKYDVATFGNHEFDWGQTVLADRTTQADYPFVTANIVTNDTGSCDTAGWTTPSFASGPYVVKTVAGVKVAFIGVTTQETPTITIASATQGLCFKDPATSIEHYYGQMKAAADVIVVLSHLGFNDGGYGYGLPVYGDKTLASKLNAAGDPVSLIIGGHSHTNFLTLTPPAPTGVTVGNTTVTQAYYAGRQVGQADMTFDPTTKAVTVTWKIDPVSTTGAEDATVKAVVDEYANDPSYQAQVSQEIGYTDVPLVRNYNGDNVMGDFVDDAIYNDLNNDATTANDVDMVFNNPGGLRTDICDPNADPPVDCTFPYKLTYGDLFSVMPFGNQTVVGDMKGFQIMDLLNQSASLTKGAIQVAGIQFKFYHYAQGDPAVPYAWGAYDACVINKTTGACDPLQMNKTYRVGTNEFLAPAGGDFFYAFRSMANITYWGDMLNLVDDWVSKTYTQSNPYDGKLDGRITRDGTDAGGTTTPPTLTSSIAPGVNRGTTGFGTSSVVLSKPGYVTVLVKTDKALAGQVVTILTKTKTSDWTAVTQRQIAADGTVHYYAKVSGWTGFVVRYAGETSHGRIATSR
jgi:5'-nucleotidase / UDP-sugar diphosphatase